MDLTLTMTVVTTSPQSGSREFNNVSFLNGQPPPAQLCKQMSPGWAKLRMQTKMGAVVVVPPRLPNAAHESHSDWGGLGAGDS